LEKHHSKVLGCTPTNNPRLPLKKAPSEAREYLFRYGATEILPDEMPTVGTKENLAYYRWLTLRIKAVAPMSIVFAN